jgi:DNA-directed RNA polymerase subunit RPC12/RpoP
MSNRMLVKCLRCGKGWFDEFTDETAKCPNCGCSEAEVLA